MTPWGWFAIAVCILAAAFCARLRCESERSMAALGARLKRLEQRPVEPALIERRVEWWCTAPAVAHVNSDEPSACFWSRKLCESIAGSAGSTCVVATAPLCFDISLRGESTPRDVHCYFDIVTCERARRSFEGAGRDCYRATSGFGYEQARNRPE